MPSTPFIGVRISWLIAARKVDFARLAASASARAASATVALAFCGFACRLQLFEQPHVLDRDHGLVGEGRYEFDLTVGEGLHRGRDRAQ